MTDFSVDDARRMSAICLELARRSRGKVRSRAILALDALAVLLDEDEPGLPTGTEIGALLDLIKDEIERENADHLGDARAT